MIAPPCLWPPDREPGPTRLGRALGRWPWLRDLVVAAALLGPTAAIAAAVWFNGWDAGYQRGAASAVEQLGDVAKTGECAVGYSGYQRCLRLADGRLVFVRGLR